MSAESPGREYPLGELLLTQEHLPAFRATRSGDALRANGALARLLGLESPRDLEGTVLRDWLVDGAGWTALTHRLWGHGGVAGHSLTLRRRDGASVTATLDATEVVDVVRGERHVFGVLVETTPEAPFTPGLHDRERWFRGVSHFGSDLVAVLDTGARIRYVNRAAQHMVGTAVKDLHGRLVTSFVHPEDRARVREALEASLREPGTRHALEVRVADARGQERTIHAAGAYLPDFPGGDCIVVVGSDVTSQRALERECREAQKLEAVAMLAGGMAHDFNNLLTTILGHSQLVARSLREDDPRRRSCEEIREAAARGARLTRQMLAIGRAHVMASRPLSVAAVVSGLATMLGRLMPEGVRFETELARDVPAVKADPGALEQVLLNLVTNARDAVSAGGSVVVRVGGLHVNGDRGGTLALAPGEYVELSVQDDGSGMDDAVRARVFEPFFTTKTPGRGSGLGLATAHGLVRQLGGAIAVDTAPGNGSTFRVLLPALPGTPEPGVVARGEGADDAPRSSGVGVLLVEDDPTILRVTRETLRRLGHRVWTAADAGSALALAATLDPAPPRVLVSDVVLPDEDGITLARRLLSRWPHLRVVLTSGYSNQGERVAGLVAEGHEYVPKPYSSDSLSRAIADVMLRSPRP